MKPCRLHITGASGSGTTTLGRAIAQEWGVPHADSDDYFWLPSPQPFTTQRAPELRVPLMREVFAAREAWVLSGSLTGWGDSLAVESDAFVFLVLSHDTRLERLRQREYRRYGDLIEPGGARYESHREFLEWASSYDDPHFDGRSLHGHREWLSTFDIPVLELDSSVPVAELVTAVLDWQPA